MTTVQQHYDHHLGPIYNWMIGDFEASLQRQRDFLFVELGLPPGAGKWAVDLGAGSGLQSVPLAESGYKVLALEVCRTLSHDLSCCAARREAGSIRVVCADLVHFRQHLAEPASVIVCMGDTLPHLPSRHAVSALVRDIAAALAPEGVFVATFRDYFSRELAGPQRFIPVRGDDRRILTCFLEYLPDHVQVHDLVHQRDEGQWRFSVSSYRKLRLSKDWLLRELQGAGLEVARDQFEGGMIQLVARKS